MDVEVVGRRKRPAVAGPHHHEMIGARIGEGLDHQCPQRAEHGGSGADADSKGENGDGGKCARFGEVAQGETQVRKHGRRSVGGVG